MTSVDDIQAAMARLLETASGPRPAWPLVASEAGTSLATLHRHADLKSNFDSAWLAATAAARLPDLLTEVADLKRELRALRATAAETTVAHKTELDCAAQVINALAIENGRLHRLLARAGGQPAKDAVKVAPAAYEIVELRGRR